MTDDDDEEEVEDLDALAKGMERGPTSNSGKPPSAAQTGMHTLCVRPGNVC